MEESWGIRMSNLFNISSDFVELFDRYDEICESGDEDAMQAWWDTIEGIDGEFHERAAEIALHVKQLRAEAELIKDEIDVLTERMKARTVRADGLTKYLMDAMAAMGLDKIEEPRVKLTVRTNPESVQLADKAAFIAWAKLDGRVELLKFPEPTVSLTAVKDALRSGEEIPGASIVRTKRLEVK